MKFDTFTFRFFRGAFLETFPGYDKCLTGTAISSIMGIAPWENRVDLYERLINRTEKKALTWEMRRLGSYKSHIIRRFSSTSPSAVYYLNPMKLTKCPLYVCDIKTPNIGGIVDGFLVERRNGHLCAGYMVRTAGLSSARFWDKHPSHIYTAQSLFYMGLCGLSRWVISVMLFDKDKDGNETIPKTIRSFHMKFDQAVYDYIYREVSDFWHNNVEQEVYPTPYLSPEFNDMFDKYVETKTSFLREIKPFEDQ